VRPGISGMYGVGDQGGALDCDQSVAPLAVRVVGSGVW